MNTFFIFTLIFFSSFIGINTGGSALIIIPLCILLGFSPHCAIITTRIGSLGATLAGWYAYKKNSKIHYRIGLIVSCITSLGAAIGAKFLHLIAAKQLERGIGFFTLLAILATFSKDKIQSHIQKKHSQHKIPFYHQIIGLVLLFLVGIFSGMIGGQGVFINIILILSFRLNFLEAVSTRCIINLIISIVTLIAYQKYTQIDWYYTAIMVLAMSTGSYCGAMYGLKKGEQWIQNVFYIVSTLLAVKCIF